MAKINSTFADVMVWSDQITPYDEQHFLTYARLLDAERENADWREVARIVLLLDPEKNVDWARQCWQTHLDRAKWIATTGYQQLLDRAELQFTRN